MAAMAETAEIRLLGELEVLRSGRCQSLPASKKTRALLGYLALTGRAHTREQLCDLLWQGPDDPRAALRWSLAKLRSVLGPEALDANRERVTLRALVTDLDEVRALLQSGLGAASVAKLSGVATRFRGELLEGLELPDCYRYHEWCMAEREAARALRVSVLAALVERAAANPEEALSWARQRVTLDPLSEAAHASVVRLLAELGRKREALSQYETCIRILAQELGASPSPALLEARMQIGASSRAAIGATRSEPASPSRSESVLPAPNTEAFPRSGSNAFVGRSIEIGVVERALSRAAQGQAEPVLLVLGEPGIGKSRLLDELSGRTIAAGGSVLAGRAFEAEMVRPYGPWLDALRAIPAAGVPSALRSELGALLPEPSGSGASDRMSLFDSVVRLLVHLAAQQGPVVIVLDDLHWFDEASAALLHYVARALGASRVLIACSARPGELSDNPAALRLVRALARERHSSAIALEPLDEQATAALCREIDTEVDVARVIRESAGNPLLAIELARVLVRGGSTAWDSIGGLIADRFENLGPAASELLTWAAALGKSFDLATLELVSGASPLDLLTHVGELERHGIIRAGSAGADYDFVHDLVRAGAYRRLSEPRRRVLHRCIARALAPAGVVPDALAGEVVHHAALGGESELAARSALLAALRCLRMFAGQEAFRLAEAGLEQLAGAPRERRIDLQIALLATQVYSRCSHRHVSRIEIELSRTIIEAQDAGLRDKVAEGFQALSILQFDRGDLGGARESTLRAAQAIEESSPLARAQQLGSSARCLALLERDVREAQAMYKEAQALASLAGVRILSVEACGGLLCAHAGETEQALALSNGALALSRSSEDRWMEFECLRCIVQIELEVGRPVEALRRCAELLDVAPKLGEGSEAPVARALAALCKFCCGGQGTSTHLEDSIAELRSIDAKGMLAYVLILAAERDVETGQLDAGERRAHEALGAAQIVSRKSQMTLARMVLARVAQARNDSEAARRLLDTALPDLEEPHAISARARATVKQVCYAGRGGCNDA
jgi:DNA-binding SARP family transcriptional activator